MFDNTLLKMWIFRTLVWDGLVRTKASQQRFDNVVKNNMPSCYDEAGYNILQSHLRSDEEFLTQILYWLLDKHDVFRSKFCETLKIAASCRFLAETPEDVNRFDLRIVDGNGAFYGIIECKKEADFNPAKDGKYQDQITKYKEFLQEEFGDQAEARLFTITKYPAAADKVRNAHSWYEVYTLLDQVENERIRNDVKEVFQYMRLDCKDFFEPEFSRKELVGEIKNFIEIYRSKNMQLHGNRTSDKATGFFNFTVYFPEKCTRLEGDGSRYLYAIPSLNIECSGYLLGCKQQKESRDILLQLRASILPRSGSTVRVSPLIVNGCAEAIKANNWQLTIPPEYCKEPFLSAISYPGAANSISEFMARAGDFIHSAIEEFAKQTEQ